MPNTFHLHLVHLTHSISTEMKSTNSNTKIKRTLFSVCKVFWTIFASHKQTVILQIHLPQYVQIELSSRMSTEITNQSLCIKIQCSLILESSVLVLLVTVCSSSLRLLRKPFFGICRIMVNQLERRQAPFVSDCNFKFPDVVSHISHSICGFSYFSQHTEGCFPTGSITWHQPCNNQTALSGRHFGGYSKTCYKKLVSYLGPHVTRAQQVCLRAENSAG